VASGSTQSPDKLPTAAGYAVGYGRPPTWAQFRPGRSGNPKGRPKKESRNKDSMARETLEQKIVVDKDGRPRKQSLRQTAYQRIGEKAFSGDIKSVNFLLARENDERQHASVDHDVPPETALEIIRAFLEREKTAKGDKK
jgi:hypothetical protein